MKSLQCNVAFVAFISDLNLIHNSKEQDCCSLHLHLIRVGHLVFFCDSG